MAKYTTENTKALNLFDRILYYYEEYICSLSKTNA